MKLIPPIVLAAALIASPASSDNGQRFDMAAQIQAYSPVTPVSRDRCFNGRQINGANRAGDATLYVQPTQGGVYSMQLDGACATLDAAEKITLRSRGGYRVCERESADVVVHTEAGTSHCAVSRLRQLTSTELRTLASAPRR